MATERGLRTDGRNYGFKKLRWLGMVFTGGTLIHPLIFDNQPAPAAARILAAGYRE